MYRVPNCALSRDAFLSGHTIILAGRAWKWGGYLFPARPSSGFMVGRRSGAGAGPRFPR